MSRERAPEISAATRSARPLRQTGLGEMLTRLAVAHPRLASEAFAWIGRRARGRLGTAPDVSELAALLPELSRARLAEACAGIGAQERRNQVLFLLVEHRGMEALAPLVEVADAGGLDAARSGASLLAMWHTGAPLVELPAIERLGRPALVPEPANPYDPGAHPKVRFVNIHKARAGRLAFLKLAGEHLRRGEGPVVFFVDGQEGERPARAPFLDRAVRVGRGIASLARLSGAPILPVTTRWLPRGRIEAAFHAPLPAVARDPAERWRYEDAVLEAIAGWFEAYVREHPERLRLRFLRGWLAEPRVAPAGGD